MKFENLPQVVAVVGSREFPKLQWVKKFVNSLNEHTIVVSGGARGVDTAAEQAACANPQLYAKVFAVEAYEWDIHGKKAGHVRNGHIVKYIKDYGGVVVVFYTTDEKGVMTRGSTDVVNKCLTEKVPYLLISNTGEFGGTYKYS